MDVHPEIEAVAASHGLPTGAVGLAALWGEFGFVDAHRKDWPNAEALVARGWATLEPIPRARAYKRMMMTEAGCAALYETLRMEHQE